MENNAQMRIRESADGSSWSSVKFSGSMSASSVYILYTGTTSTPTRFIEVIGANSSDFYLDAILFNAISCQPAAPDLDVSGNFDFCASPVLIAPALTITDAANQTISSAYVQIGTGFVSAEDRLSCTNAFGITSNYNQTYGVLYLSGEATTSQYQSVLRSVLYNNISGTPTLGNRQIIFSLERYNAIEDHYYRYVAAPNIYWSTARLDADRAHLFGMQGYLVTITSDAENNFLLYQMTGATWLGGSDFFANESDWYWMTGPEAGTMFWQGLTGGTELTYANWNPGAEPNNYNGNDEVFAHIYAPGSSNAGTWNDELPAFNGAGYYVEFGGMPGDPDIDIEGIVNVNVITGSPVIPSVNGNNSVCPNAAGVVYSTANVSGHSYSWVVTGGVISNGQGTNSITVNWGSTNPGTVKVTESIGGACSATTPDFSVFIGDNVNPVITGSIPVTNIEGCNISAAPSPVTTVAALESMGLTISDNCTPDASLVVTSGDVSVGTCPIVITRTYTVTDAYSNFRNVNHTIRIDDNTAPAITGTLTAIAVEGCTAVDRPAATLTLAYLRGAGLTITDACGDGGLTVTSSDGAPGGTCPITIVRTYRVTDACGNYTTAAQTITIDDNTAPAITGTLTAIAVEGCTAVDRPAATLTLAYLRGAGLTITDACGDGGLTVTSSDGAPGGTCPITIVRTYRVTDACGNYTTAAQTITIDDNTAPAITGTLTAIAVEGCTAVDRPAATLTLAYLRGAGLTITDACGDGGLTVTSSDGAPGGTCPITIVRTYRVTDACGNYTTAAQTITIDDNTAPAITGTLTAIAVEGCTAVDRPAATLTLAYLRGAGLTITDACGDGGLTVTSSDGAPGGTCPITIVRTYRVTDACGNYTTAAQTITIDDNTAPAITGTLTAIAVEGCTAVDRPAATLTLAYLRGAGLTITDACGDGGLTVTSSDGAPGGTCPITIVRTYRVTDACGNYTTAAQTITIDDNTAPAITGTLTAIAVEGCTAVDRPAATLTLAYLRGAGLTITDACGDGGLTVTSSDGAPGGTCPITIVRTYRVTDACGNYTTAAQTITIDDNTAPAITGTLTAIAVEGCTAVDRPAATLTLAYLRGAGLTITDACGDGGLTVTSSDGAPGGTCPITIVRTYRVTDACGNYTTAAQTITIDDNTAPAITGTLTAIAVEGCTAVDRPAATLTLAYLRGAGLTITDACGDGGLTVTSSDGAPGGTCPITIVRTYRVTDACGNYTTAAQTITIDDNTAPAITGTLTAIAVEGCTAVDRPAATLTLAYLRGAGLTITDACGDGGLTVTSSDGAPGGTCPITIVRTYRVTDACGNYTTAAQTITIDDNTAPAITGTLTAIAVEGCTAVDRPAATLTLAYLRGAGLTITDACGDGGLTVTSSDGAPGGTCPITIVRTYRVTDACGNYTTAAQTITIDDNTAPAITGTLTAIAVEGCTAVDRPAATLTLAYLRGAGLTITDACGDGGLTVTSSDGAPAEPAR